MSDTDKATHQADCDRRIVDVICDHCEATGLRAGAAEVREMATEISKLRSDTLALLVCYRVFVPGSTDDEILAGVRLAAISPGSFAIPGITEIEQLRTEWLWITKDAALSHLSIARLRKRNAALLRYCRKLDPGATEEEILAAAGCEVPDDAVPATEEILGEDEAEMEADREI